MNDENINVEINDLPVVAKDEVESITPLELASGGVIYLQSAFLSAADSATRVGIPTSAAYASKDNAQAKSLVYALGKIGYDFGTEARGDGFTQLMMQSVKQSNPYDPKQLISFLDTHQDESNMLIWTLSIDLTPIYAIEPEAFFASGTYSSLIGALKGHLLDENDPGYIERVAISGYLTGKTVRLYSGQVVPVISVQPGGLGYWNTNKWIDAVIKSLPGTNLDSSRDTAMKTSFREFLNRICYDYRNLGTTSSERALNFAATNAFQAGELFAEVFFDSRNQVSRQLKEIVVEKSPFCRLDSDCWDVKLSFFDPENDRGAMKIVRYTIDVTDVMPVTIGEPRSWSAY